MKKILLMSDTHGYLDDQILKFVDQADEVWHAGDIGDSAIVRRLKSRKPLRAVYGNIDDQQIRQSCPLHQRFVCEGVDVWITHIGGYPPKYSPAVKPEIFENSPRLFISGHSHILKVMPDSKLGLIHMNPGAVGRHGFHKKRTMLRFEVENAEIANLEVIELGNR